MNFKKISPKLVSTEPKYKLTDQQKEFYKENGYLIIKNLFNPKRLESYKQRFSELCHQPNRVSVVKEYALLDKTKDPVHYVYKIQDIMDDDVYITYGEDPRILDIVSQFVGSNHLSGINLMLINKPPGSTRHPSHQDLWYFPFRPADKAVAMWTALDPTRLDNGCLYLVPGSHKCGKLLKHESFKDSKKFFHVIANEDELAPLDKRLYLEMDPGDTIFFHPCLIHGSGPNSTKDFRKALTLHYADSNCQYIDFKGTVQESLENEYQKSMAERGISGVSMIDYWKLKIKTVRGPKCNL